MRNRTCPNIQHIWSCINEFRWSECVGHVPIYLRPVNYSVDQIQSGSSIFNSSMNNAHFSGGVVPKMDFMTER